MWGHPSHLENQIPQQIVVITMRSRAFRMIWTFTLMLVSFIAIIIMADLASAAPATPTPSAILIAPRLLTPTEPPALTNDIHPLSQFPTPTPPQTVTGPTMLSPPADPNAGQDVPIAPDPAFNQSDIDSFVPKMQIRTQGGPRTAREEADASGYDLPNNLGLKDLTDKFFRPLNQIVMNLITWTVGIANRFIDMAFFRQLFAQTIGPRAYQLVGLEKDSIFAPLVVIGASVTILLFAWYYMGAKDAQKAQRIAVISGGSLLISWVLFTSPSLYFGAVDNTAADISGSALGSVGQVSDSMHLSSDNLQGDPQSVALRRITDTMQDHLITTTYCHAALGSQVAVTKYCARLHGDNVISASEADKIAALPSSQQDNAKSQLKDAKSADFDELVNTLKNTDPLAYDRIRGHDSSHTFMGLLLSLVVDLLIVLVVGGLAFITVISRLVFYAAIAIGPDVAPSTLFGEFGQRIFRYWIVMGLAVQLAIQALLGLLLSAILFFSYMVMSSNMPWGLQNLLVAMTFLIFWKQRNKILAKIMGSSAAGAVGARVLNRASSAAGWSSRFAFKAAVAAASGSPALAASAASTKMKQPVGSEDLRHPRRVKNKRVREDPVSSGRFTTPAAESGSVGDSQATRTVRLPTRRMRPTSAAAHPTVGQPTHSSRNDGSTEPRVSLVKSSRLPTPQKLVAETAAKAGVEPVRAHHKLPA